MEPALRAWLKDAGDLTLAERCARLAEHGIAINVPAWWHQLDQWKRTLTPPCTPASKNAPTCKPRGVSGRQPTLRWISRSWSFWMKPGRQRTWRGARCLASVPHGQWHTTTVVAGLRHDDIPAPMGADGAMTGALFLQYVQAFLCPTRHPGDIVIAGVTQSQSGGSQRGR